MSNVIDCDRCHHPGPHAAIDEHSIPSDYCTGCADCQRERGTAEDASSR